MSTSLIYISIVGMKKDGHYDNRLWQSAWLKRIIIDSIIKYSAMKSLGLLFLGDWY
jgi:hypothetical protein